MKNVWKTGSHSCLVLCLLPPPPTGGVHFYQFFTYVASLSANTRKYGRICHPPTFLTQDVHHYACSLFPLLSFLCLTVYSGKLALSERWWMTTPLIFTAVSYSTLGMFVDHPAIYRRGFQTSAIPSLMLQWITTFTYPSTQVQTPLGEKFPEVLPHLFFLANSYSPPDTHNPGARHTKRHVQRAAGSVPAFSAKLVVMA